MAKLVTVYLRLTFKRRYSASTLKATKRFMDARKAGEKKYKPPKINMGCSVIKQTVSDMDVYILNGESKSNKTILFIHGGGYVHQALYYHWRLIKKLIKLTDAKVILPIYPLAPFHTYKDMYDKINALYAEYTDTDDELIFMGDSAGGGFVVSYYEYLIDSNLRTPDKVIAISPWLDLDSANPDMAAIEKRDPMLVQRTLKLWADFWAGNDRHSYTVSPINFDRLDELKNVTIYIGTDEILYPDAVKFFDKLSDKHNSLIVAERMNHDYPLYPIPEAKKALDSIASIITEPKAE